MEHSREVHELPFRFLNCLMLKQNLQGLSSVSEFQTLFPLGFFLVEDHVSEFLRSQLHENYKET